jgi:predicted RNA-binding Zn ribbon-like protein
MSSGHFRLIMWSCSTGRRASDRRGDFGVPADHPGAQKANGQRVGTSIRADDRLPAEAELAWSGVTARNPGRLRACANSECGPFLVDHTRPRSAKWCSMATCGNRMKERAYEYRSRS